MKAINTLIDRFFGPAADTLIAGCLVHMAQIGRDAARVMKDSRCKDLEKIADFERQSDAVEKRIHELLDGAFQLRYFDKRDIEHISKELDDIVDGMRRIAKHVADYQIFFAPADFPQEAEHLLEIICQMTEMVHSLMTRVETRHLPIAEISRMVDVLDKDESAADAELTAAKAVLVKKYAPDGNAIEFDAWKELHRMLEKITDSANHVGDLVLSIARK